MAAEASWTDTDMPDGAITPSAAIPVPSADIQSPVLIRTVIPLTPITAFHSIKLLLSAALAEFRSIQLPHPTPGVMVPGRLFLHPSMSAANPASADDLPQKPHLTPSAEISAPAADTVKKQRPL